MAKVLELMNQKVLLLQSGQLKQDRRELPNAALQIGFTHHKKQRQQKMSYEDKLREKED